MKLSLAFILALLVLSLTACGEKKAEVVSVPETTTAEETTAEETTIAAIKSDIPETTSAEETTAEETSKEEETEEGETESPYDYEPPYEDPVSTYGYVCNVNTSGIWGNGQDWSIILDIVTVDDDTITINQYATDGKGKVHVGEDSYSAAASNHAEALKSALAAAGLDAVVKSYSRKEDDGTERFVDIVNDEAVIVEGPDTAIGAQIFKAEDSSLPIQDCYLNAIQSAAEPAPESAAEPASEPAPAAE